MGIVVTNFHQQSAFELDYTNGESSLLIRLPSNKLLKELRSCHTSCREQDALVYSSWIVSVGCRCQQATSTVLARLNPTLSIITIIRLSNFISITPSLINYGIKQADFSSFFSAHDVLIILPCIRLIIRIHYNLSPRFNSSSKSLPRSEGESTLDGRLTAVSFLVNQVKRGNRVIDGREDERSKKLTRG